MNVTPPRNKYFPPSRRFGFKRPVLLDDVDEVDKEEKTEETENSATTTVTTKQNEEKSADSTESADNAIKEENVETPKPPPRVMIQPLSFSISCELLAASQQQLQESNAASPDFDWVQEEIDGAASFAESSKLLGSVTDGLDALNDDFVF